MFPVQSQPRFGAIPIAKYSVPTTDGHRRKTLALYEIESKDQAVFQSLKEQAERKTLLPEDNGQNKLQPHYDNIYYACIDALRILDYRKLPNLRPAFKDRSVIYLAVCDQKPCGLLIGNVPKRDREGNITFSYRNQPQEAETELDWLVTWPFKQEKDRIKGVGSILLGQFYRYAKNKTVVLRSELPENTVAHDFYTRMGCEGDASNRIPWQGQDDPIDLISIHHEPNAELVDYPTIPMKIESKEAGLVLRNIAERFNYRHLKHQSIPITQVVSKQNLSLN